MESTMVEIKKSRHDLLDLIQVAYHHDVHLKVVYSNLSQASFGYEGEMTSGSGSLPGRRLTICRISSISLYKSSFEEALLRRKDEAKSCLHLLLLLKKRDKFF
jgi:hypothetical protein